MFNIDPLVFWVLGAAVLGAAITWFAEWLVFWKGTFGDKQLFVEVMIESLAEVAEKMYKEKGQGKEKLAWVLGCLLVMCEQRGITFDTVKMTELINDYVLKVLNAAKQPTPEKKPDTVS